MTKELDKDISEKKLILSKLETSILEATGRLRLVQEDFTAYQNLAKQLESEVNSIKITLGFIKDVKEAKDLYEKLTADLEIKKVEFENVGKQIELERQKGVEALNDFNDYVANELNNIAQKRAEADDYEKAKIKEVDANVLKAKELVDIIETSYDELLKREAQVKVDEKNNRDILGVITTKSKEMDKKLESEVIILEETKSLVLEQKNLQLENDNEKVKIITAKEEIADSQKRLAIAQEENDKTLMDIVAKTEHDEEVLKSIKIIEENNKELLARTEDNLNEIDVRESKLDKREKDLDIREAGIKSREIIVVNDELKNKETLAFIDLQNRQEKVKK